jgi:hypothetical protein
MFLSDITSRYQTHVHSLMTRFARDSEQSNDASWEEQLAQAYESKLFREYALVRPRLCYRC